MSDGTSALLIEPVVSWPRLAEAGRSYLVTVDLRTPQPSEEWAYEEEELRFSFSLDGAPYFTCEALNDPSVVLHRFGGTYGPARFVVGTGPAIGSGSLWLTISNRWGVPIRRVELRAEIIPGAENEAVGPGVLKETAPPRAGDTAPPATEVAASPATGEQAPSDQGPAHIGPAYVVGEVPRRPPAFQSREDLLAALGRHLSQGPVVQAVIGMRGTGKTQLAAAYARSRIKDRWRLVAWVNALDYATMLAGLAEVAAHLELSAPGEDPETIAAAVRYWLESDGEGCLLVFDDVDDVNGLRRILPAGGHAEIVITSVHQSAAALGGAVPVGVFSEAESIRFLAERTGSTDTNEAQLLAAELSYLPLALSQAAATIAAQHLSYSTYLERLRAVPIEIFLKRPSGDPYPRGVAATMLLAIDSAVAVDPSGLAETVLDLIAILASADVTRTLLYVAGRSGGLGPPIPDSEAQAEVDTALAHLIEASILTVIADGSSVTVNQLVSRVVREKLTRQEHLAATGATAAGILQTAADSLGPAWRDPGRATYLFRQIMALNEHLAPVLTGSGTTGLMTDLLSLRGLAVQWLIELGDSPDLAVAYGQQLARDCELTLGPDHPDTLTSQDHLALAYLQTGQTAEALPLFERALADSERVRGVDHPATRAIRENLAAAQQPTSPTASTQANVTSSLDGPPVDRVVAVVADLGNGNLRTGSGYLVNDRLVLTAQHLTVDGRTGRPARALRVVRISDGAEVAVTVVAAALDAAVLTVADDPPWAGAISSRPPQFGRVDRSRAAVLRDCQARFLPSQPDPRTWPRSPEELRGAIWPADGVRSGLLTMREPVRRSVLPGAGGSGDAGKEPTWSGVSGALVFHQGLALGVVIERHLKQAAITILPVDRLAAGDPDTTAVAVALGLPPADELPLAGESLLAPLVKVLIQGRLPRVAELDPYTVGAAPSQFGNARTYGERDPYIPRKVDEPLEIALRPGQLVVLTGPAKAGKTRTAFECIHGHPFWGDGILAAPEPQALDELAGHPALGSSDPLVIWLDDLQSFLTPRTELSEATVARFLSRPGPTAFLATVRSLQWDLLQDARSAVSRRAGTVLRDATLIELNNGFDSDEQVRAAVIYPQAGPRPGSMAAILGRTEGNPFIAYGTIASDERFVGRERERRSLQRRLYEARSSAALISLARMGKSSLANNILKVTPDEKTLTGWINVATCRSGAEVMRDILAICPGETGSRAELPAADSAGEAAEIPIHDVYRTLREALLRLDESDGHLVTVLDEFDSVRAFPDSRDFLNLLRELTYYPDRIPLAVLVLARRPIDRIEPADSEASSFAGICDTIYLGPMDYEQIRQMAGRSAELASDAPDVAWKYAAGNPFLSEVAFCRMLEHETTDIGHFIQPDLSAYYAGLEDFLRTEGLWEPLLGLASGRGAGVDEQETLLRHYGLVNEAGEIWSSSFYEYLRSPSQGAE